MNDLHLINFKAMPKAIFNKQDPQRAVLKLYGDIGEDFPGSIFEDAIEMISAKSVSDFIEAHPEATDITVRINSRGGDVQEGWAIHDLLVNSGKRIKTIGEGKIYSIATIVFLAGTEREMMKNADGLIHNPFIPPYTLADKYESDDLEKIAESLRQEEVKILDFYCQRTGSPRDMLEKFMNEDTKLSAEDMLNLGFATKIVEPVMAYAYLKPKNEFIMDEKLFFERLGTALDNAVLKIKGFSRIDPTNLTLTDKDGKEFTIEKESGDPAVGDTATPDGTFTMANGKIIVIAEGVISDIQEAEPDETELDKANAKIAELQASLDAKTAAEAEAEAVVTEARARQDEAVALVAELSKLKNEWKPAARSQGGSAEKTGAIDLARVKELKEKLNQKTE